MVNVSKLKGLIVERGKTQAEVAKYIGISEKTFYNKMQKRVFNSDEISLMIKFLNIDITEAPHIFFN